MTDFFYGFMFGIGMTAFSCLVINSILASEIKQQVIKEYQQSLKDCKVPSYYYLDEHRKNCDNIQVMPDNVTKVSSK